MIDNKKIKDKDLEKISGGASVHHENLNTIESIKVTKPEYDALVANGLISEGFYSCQRKDIDNILDFLEKNSKIKLKECIISDAKFDEDDLYNNKTLVNVKIRAKQEN